LFNVFFVLVTIIFIVILYIQTNNQNVLINSYNGWIYADSRRLGLSLVLIIDADYIIGITNGLLKNEFISTKIFKQHILSFIAQFKECHEMLLDAEEHGTVMGRNSDFDKWNFIDRCEIPSDLQLNLYPLKGSLILEGNVEGTLTGNTIDPVLSLPSLTFRCNIMNNLKQKFEISEQLEIVYPNEIDSITNLN
jgi:hypothetical protein